MSNEKEVVITESIYNHLMMESRFLELLEEFGVDNWDGFEDVQNEYERRWGSYEDD